MRDVITRLLSSSAVPRVALIALLVGLFAGCADDPPPPPPRAAVHRDAFVVDIWTQGFESSSWASDFNSVIGSTNTSDANHLGRFSSGGFTGATGSFAFRFQANATSSGATTPTYAHELRKQVNTSGYTDVTLIYSRAIAYFEGATTVNGVSLTDRFSVRYSTVASPGPSDWTEIHAGTSADNVGTPAFTQYTVTGFPSSSTLWISFLGDLQPQEPTNDNYAFNEYAFIDQIILRGDNGCDTDADCNDSHACTTDSCNTSTGACSNTPLSSGSTCNDRALPGGGTGSGYCAGGNTCVECITAGHCSDDSNACTIGPVCTSNVCGNGPPPDCSDGLFCNGTETCNTSSGCQAGTPPTLTDGILCTTDACNESTDQVTHTPFDSACDDMNGCTDDACSASTGCSNSAVLNRTCSAGYCDATGGCVECTQDSQCGSGNEHCSGDHCVCTPDTCEDQSAECGLFADNGCGAMLDCTDECVEGTVCDMSEGYENGVCGGHCSDGVENEDEEGRDCGGSCSVACTESLCADGLDDDGDELVDCEDLDCVEAGFCDSCAEHLLGHADWGFESNAIPSFSAVPETLRFTLSAPHCADSLGPVELSFGETDYQDFTSEDESFEPFVTCLRGLWDERDIASSVQPAVKLSVDVLGSGSTHALFEQQVPLPELFAFDVEEGAIQRLRLVVSHASFDAMAIAVRLDFRWEAIGYHDADCDCLACTAFDSDAISLDFCSERCPCDIGEGGCEEDSDCRRGLVCEPRGALFGYVFPGLSVCVPEHCTNGVPDGDETGATNGEAPDGVDCGGDRCGACPADCALEPGCTPSCPCDDYEGPCADDADCDEGSACGHGNAGRFGQPNLENMCWPAACEAPGACGTPECGPCEECEYWPVDCATSAPPRVESLAFGSSSLRGTIATFVNDDDLVEYVGPHVLRVKEGATGPLSLFEGERTNFALQSSQPHSWPTSQVDLASSGPAPFINAAGQSAVVSAAYAVSESAVPTASGDQFLSRALVLPSLDGEALTASLWTRKQSGTAIAGSVVLDTDSIHSQTFTPTSTWARYDNTAVVGSDGLVDVYFALNAWGSSSAAHGYELDIAMPQIEAGTFPSSWIWTYGSPATRELDRVVMDARVVPPWLVGGAFELEIEPVFGTSDLAETEQDFVLLEFGSNDQWLGLHSDGEGSVELVAQAGVQRTVLVLPELDRGEAFVATVSPVSGELETSLGSGIATGPAWRWPSRALSVGARSSGTHADAAFAWIGQPQATIEAAASCSTIAYEDHASCGHGASWCVEGECIPSASCGDGRLDVAGTHSPAEGCDDGNNVDGDGCSAACEAEAVSIQLGDVALEEPGKRTHAVGADGDGALLLVWQSFDGETSRVLARRISSNGLPSLDDEPPIELASDIGARFAVEPSVVGLPNKSWLVAWTARDGAGPARIVARRVARDGSLGDVIAVADADVAALVDASAVRLAPLGSGAIAVWSAATAPASSRSILAQQLDALGSPIGSQLSISSSASADETDVAVASDGIHWIAAWSDVADRSIKVRRFVELLPEENAWVLAANARSPVVAALPGAEPTYAIAWVDVDDEQVHTLELVPGAMPSVQQATVIADAPRRPVFPAVAALGVDGYVVSFGYGDGYRDADFRVLPRAGHLHTPSPSEASLRDLLTGPSNQRGVEVTSTPAGVWFSWSDDGMPRGADPHALPNGIRMFLLGCADCANVPELECTNDSQRLLPDDLTLDRDTAFGFSFDVSGDRLIVGAYDDGENTARRGAAFVYERRGSRWVEQAKLTSSFTGPLDPGLGSGVGWDVAIDGNTAVVSTPFIRREGLSDYAGIAYIFEYRNGEWRAQQEIVPEADDEWRFGATVDLAGDWLMVSKVVEVNLSGSVSYPFSVDVYHRENDGWEFQQTLEKIAPRDSAGAAGTKLDDEQAFVAGFNSERGAFVSVYELQGGDWNHVQEISLPDGIPYYTYVARDGDVLLIGAPSFDDGAIEASGAVLVYHHDGSEWLQSDTLRNPEPNTNAFFGYTLGVENHAIAVGAYSDTDTFNESSLYVFQANAQGEAEWVDEVSGAYGSAIVDVAGGQLFYSVPLEPEPGYPFAPGSLYVLGCSASRGCGDGLRTAAELCDDGNRVTESCPDEGSCNVCTSTCELYVPTCGDGFVEAPIEECDDGNAVTEYCSSSPAMCDGETCTALCTLGATGYCGDGIVQEAEEECDDANLVAHDGCDSCEESECITTSSSDTICDNVDNDCDGDVDEDYEDESVSCGLGVCAATGSTYCVSGEEETACSPGSSTGSDNDCDGVNDDCDTSTDEEYSTSSSSCGVGACARTGSLTCVSGSVSNSCTPGSTTGTDNDCDAIDDDCDTHTDESYANPASSCGTGLCAATGNLHCVDGSPVSDCVPGSPRVDDFGCDNVDEDCDGSIDEDCPCTVATSTVAAHVTASRAFACNSTTAAVFFSTGFETGGTLSGWTATGNYSASNMTAQAGTWSAQAQGTGLSTLRRTFDTSMFTSATLTFNVRSRGELTAGYGIDVRRSTNGTTWTSVATHTGPLNSWTAASLTGQPSNATLSYSFEATPTDTARFVHFDTISLAATCTTATWFAVGTNTSLGTNSASSATLHNNDAEPGIWRTGACAVCGDGTADSAAGETCDDGNRVIEYCGASSCTTCGPHCTSVAGTYCGDGVVQAVVEECDDGNSNNVDGCNNDCEVGCVATSSSDTTCDGVDQDCDDELDEDYAPTTTTCGVGACAAAAPTSCVSGSVVDECEPGMPSSEVCNGIDDDCDGTVDDSCPAEAKLESGVVAQVGATPVTVTLKNHYASPVVVTTIHFKNNTLPVVTRIQNVGHHTFQVYLQVPTGQTPAAEKISYLVVEEGVWTIDGNKIEAHTHLSTTTSYRGGTWVAQQVAYGQSYTNPVVLGQVMSTNDTRFSAFWDSNGTFGQLPSATSLYIGKHVSDDPAHTRANEILGYIVLETTSSGTIGGVPYRAHVDGWGVPSIAANPPFGARNLPTMTSPPEVVVATAAATLDRGSWLYNYGDPSASSRELFLVQAASGHSSHNDTGARSAITAFLRPVVYPAPTCGNEVVEPGEDCDEGDAVTEYCASGETCSVCNAQCKIRPGGYCGDLIRQTANGEACDDGNVVDGDGCSADCSVATPKLETGTVSVGGSPLTVHLRHEYDHPIVVSIIHYVNNTLPVVTRVYDVTGTEFKIYLQIPTGQTPATDKVSYLVVEEGVWSIDGVKLEARKYRSKATSHFNHWAGERAEYGQSYSVPVVLGQVMSVNDTRFSAFWSTRGEFTLPPTGASLYIGKHVSQDSDRARADEDLGYIVIEGGVGPIGGVSIRAYIEWYLIQGVTSNPPFVARPFIDVATNAAVPFANAPEVIVGSVTGEAQNGGWLYLYGDPAASSRDGVFAADSSSATSPARNGGGVYGAIVAFERQLTYPIPSCGNNVVEPGEDCDDGDTLTNYCPSGAPCERCNAQCKTANGGFCGDGILQSANSEVCDDGNTSNGDACNATCTTAAPKLETGTIQVGASATTVNLKHTYSHPVVVTTIHYKNNTLPVVARVRNVASQSFQAYLQIPTGGTPTAEMISYLVVEEGVWNIGSTKLEAHTHNSTTTSDWDHAVGERVTYGQSYTTPVVLGQVMTTNDTRFSNFWSSNGNPTLIANSSRLYIGKHVHDDPVRTRANETLGYVIFDAGSGSIGTIDYRAYAESTLGQGLVPLASSSATPFSSRDFATAMSAPPETLLVTGGGNGAGQWLSPYGYPSANSRTAFIGLDSAAFTHARGLYSAAPAYVAFSRAGVYPVPTCGNSTVEPGETCDEGNAVTEYCAAGAQCTTCGSECTTVPGGFCGDGFLQTANGEACDDGNTSGGDACSADCATASPQLETGSVTAGATPVAVTLSHTYSSPVVVATINYVNNTQPVVARVTNVTATGFSVYLQGPTGATPVNDPVSYLVVEEGVWQIAGTKIEARKRTSGPISATQYRVGTRVPYGQSYTSPVVLGQVMSANDSRFTAFWSSNGNPANSPSATALYVGSHSSRDAVAGRVPETLGYIVLEGGSGTLAGSSYRAGSPAVATVGGGVSQPINYASTLPSAPVVGLATVSSADQELSWAYLHGTTWGTASTVYVSRDVTGSPRTVSTRVAYAVFGTAISYPAVP